MLDTGPKGALWRLRKRVVTAAVTAVLPTPPAQPLDLGRPLKVGYLRFDRRVGEVLLQTPLFRDHKAARPQDTVLAITHPKMVRVLQGQPDIDAVVPFSWRGFPFSGETRAGMAALRALGLDVAVDCSDPSMFSLGHALATRWTQAPVRVGFQRGPAADHHTLLVDVPTPLHEATARIRLLQPLGILGTPRLRFVPRPGAPVLLDSVDLVARMTAEPGRHAVVIPGGRLAWRRAGPAEFAPLCQALAEHGRTVWLAPGPGEDELCQAVLQAAPAARVLPPTDLQQLGAVMQAAGVTVCNNTGTMHLSAAVGARTFALFARMDPTRWGHFQDGNRMVSHELEDPAEPVRLRQELERWLGAGHP